MYRKTLCLASLFLAGLSTDVVGQQTGESGTPRKVKPVPATEQDYQFIEEVKQATGIILSFDDAAKTLSVRIEGTEWVPNPAYKSKNDLNNLRQRIGKGFWAQRQLDPAATYDQSQLDNMDNRIRQEMQQLRDANNNLPFNPVIHPTDFKFEMQKKVVYRKMDLEKDKVYSKDELAKLKGADSKKPGYEATASEFHAGQTVFVYLSVTKKKTDVRMLIRYKDRTTPTIPTNPKKDDAATPPPAQAEPAASFVGRWKLVNDKGVVSSYLTVTKSGAKRDHAPASPGDNWEAVGKEARFTWDDGFRDVMRLEPGGLYFYGLGKTAGWDGVPEFRLQAVRIKQ